MKKYTKYIVILVSLFLILILFILLSPKEIDWTYSFSKDDKIPYGNFVTYHVAEELFDYGFLTINKPVYNAAVIKDSGSNYIFINDNFSPDKLDAQALLNIINDGNNVFIAASYFNQTFRDTFNVNSSFSFVEDDTLKVKFCNPGLKRNHDYRFRKIPFDSYFTSFNDSNAVILGLNDSDKPNFIKLKIGDGNLYLNLIPLAFTNYNILDTANSDYIFKSLSYLPAESTTYWDEYYKAGKSMIRTPLVYVLSKESLSWAYYTSISIIIFYIIFEGKRKQRIIPVVRPLKNTTLEFIETIGKLYYQKKDHKNIAEKKINYFFDHLRNNYYIKGKSFNAEELSLIAEKSKVNLDQVKSIFNFINKIQVQNKITESDLKNLNSLIESFYNNTGNYGRTI